nr:OmpA family protein [uncultured Roseateles sp.]
MNRRAALFMLVTAMLSACAFTRGNNNAAGSEPTTEAAKVVRRIAQFGFGRLARFGECVEPACPDNTRKSLPPVPEPTSAQPSAPTPSVIPAIEPEPLPRPISATAPAPATDRHRLILHFALNSASLTATHRTLLRDALPGFQHSERIVIAGRTDDLGSAPLNQSLALARGLAVRDYLLSLDPGLPARISIDARGRCCYAAPNDDAHGRALNRRVEISHSQGSGATP